MNHMSTHSSKIFTIKAISLATFFGGFLAAGFLLYRNYKTFGNIEAARKAIFVALLATVIFFAVIFMIPESLNTHALQGFTAGIIAGAVALLTEKLQGKQIKEFLDDNGAKASNWQAVGYGLLGLMIISCYVVMLATIVPMTGYEKHIEIDQRVVLYYNKKIEEAKVQYLSQAIKHSGFTEGSEGADLFFNEQENFYRLKFVLPDPSLRSDTSLIATFNELEKYLNYNLNFEKQIEIGFTDFNLQANFDLIETKDVSFEYYPALPYLQAYPVTDKQTIFYNVAMPVEDVRKVEDAMKKLKAYFPEGQAVDIVFFNNGKDYTIKFFTSKYFWHNPAVTGRLKSTVDYIKDNGIEKNIRLVLIENQTFEENQLYYTTSGTGIQEVVKEIKDERKIANEPLFVLDGKPLEKAEAEKYLTGKHTGAVNTVLIMDHKSGVQLYGERARNGVVIINTLPD